MQFEAMGAGETIHNHARGETLTMLEGEQESGGVRQLYAVRVPPRRPSPPLHYHVAFTERFTVMEGALDFYLGRERRRVTLAPGQSVTAEIGQPHTFGNDREEWTTFAVETRPPGGVVAAFQMAYTGGAPKDGLPRNPILRLVFIRTSQGSYRGAFVFAAGFVCGGGSGGSDRRDWTKTSRLFVKLNWKLIESPANRYANLHDTLLYPLEVHSTGDCLPLRKCVCSESHVF
jgi:mannose-6-phosphate isomerase-like protein (cupin superfamily)